MNKISILFIVIFYLLLPIMIVDAYAQQKPVPSLSGQTEVKTPPEENVSEAARNELLEFYDKIKSINEDCKMKRETLRIALSAEAKKAIEDRKEERHEEEMHKQP